MGHHLRRLAVTAAAVATLLGGALAAAPPASAGNLCNTFDNVQACISSNSTYVISSGSFFVNSIPAGCVFTITLYEVFNGEGFPQFGVHHNCLKGSNGSLYVPFSVVGHGTFYNVSCANWNTGGACAYSPWLNA